jgi:DNA primase
MNTDASSWPKVITGDRLDWHQIRDRVDLADVATNLMGPAPGRRGEGGRRLWWSCPFHQDRNPSLAIEPGKPFWRCFGCGEHGDAANLVMRLRGVGFPEAVRVVTELAGFQNPKTPRVLGSWTEHRPSESPASQTPERSSGLPVDHAMALVTGAARLWTPEGTEALTYLHGRGLKDETIRAARLGWTPHVMVPYGDGNHRYSTREW